MYPVAGSIAIVSTCLLFLAFGLRRRTDGKNPVEFYLAGKRSSALQVALSLLATCLGASSTLGIAAQAWKVGWVATLWLGSGGIGLLLLGWKWAAAMRRRPETLSLPQWLGHVYGPGARTLAAILIALMWLGVIAAQWTAAGALTQRLLGIGFLQGMILSAGTVALYTTVGGQESVLKTDAVQALCIAGAVLVCFVAALRLPVPGALPAASPPGEASARWSLKLGIERAAMVWVLAAMYTVGPDMCSRVLTARDDRAARNAAFLAAPALVVLAVLLVFPALRLRATGITLANDRDVLPVLLTSQGRIPAALGIAGMLGLLAAVLSSADTCLLTISTVITNDLLKRPDVRTGRLVAGAAAGLSLLVAWRSPGIVSNLLAAYSFYCGGLLVPLLLLAWPRLAAAVPKPAVMAAIVAGGSMPLLCSIAGVSWEMYSSAFLGNIAAAVILLVATGIVRKRSA